MTSRPCDVCTATTDAYICKPCAAEIERAIAEAPSQLHELGVAWSRQARIYRANGSTPRPAGERGYDPQAHLPAMLRSRMAYSALPATQMPVNLSDADDLQWATGNTLSSWARHIAESRGIELPAATSRERRRLYIERNRMRVFVERLSVDAVMPLVAWLLTHVESIRWDEAARQMHEELTGMRRDNERAVDRSPDRVYAGPCHTDNDGVRCERDVYAPASAFRDDDDEPVTIICDGYRGDWHGCKARHDMAARREWLAASVEDQLVPLPLLRAVSRKLFALEWPPAGTVRSWLSRGMIMAHGTDRMGEPLYRGGEVLDRVRDERVRTGRRTRRVA